ncbi:hypothetical protein SCHPADRAFT_819801, partial [Schizopora paradoxa]
MVDEGEKPVKDPNYVFCPAIHRHQALRIFTKHYCQHQLLPERDVEGQLTPLEIRTKAVSEMYQYCKKRGLRELWGYAWASWYSPAKWKLWARSNSEYITRLRTTMNAENHWRQVKHNHLHHLIRPRLDQLVWILITKVFPQYHANANILNVGYRLGRFKALTTSQEYFKREWKRLA